MMDRVAFLVNLVVATMATVMATATRTYLRWQNAKLEKGQAVGRSGPTLVQQAAGFRYLLWWKLGAIELSDLGTWMTARRRSVV